LISYLIFFWLLCIVIRGPEISEIKEIFTIFRFSHQNFPRHSLIIIVDLSATLGPIKGIDQTLPPIKLYGIFRAHVARETVCKYIYCGSLNHYGMAY
jgi:hypothetical protein